MSADDLTPEQRLRRLQDDERWNDTTLTPRRLPSRTPLVQRMVAVAAVLVVAAGLLVGLGALAVHSFGSASSASKAGPAASAAAGSSDGAVPTAQGAPAPFATGAPSTTFQSGQGRAPLAPFAVTVAGPSTAPAGTTLRLVVTLRNIGAKSIALAPCPDYRQTLTVGASRVTQHYTLNCSSVAVLPAGGSAAFAMRIPIPATASGTADYTWTLDDGSSAHFTLRVTKR